MPRETIPFIRKGGFLDAEKLFILSFEGERTETKYFEDFRNSEIFNDSGLIETIPLKRAENTGTDPFSVKKLLKKAKEEYPFKKTDEFWLIIDRDHWESTHKLSFEQLVEECNAEKNFFLAMSNPCIEIWLVLHLKDLAEFTTLELKSIYENAKISNSKNYIDKVLSGLIGRGYNKKPNPKVFLPLTMTAIIRAKALDNLQEAYPTQIGTHLYKLIEKLIKPQSPNA